MKSVYAYLLIVLFLNSCSVRSTRSDALATAYRYTQVEWMPESRHVRHGPDSKGIQVHTPDQSVSWEGDKRGWWKPGVPAKGMPYQWGGFDTPESFLEKIAAGKKAGDIGDAAKRKLGDAGTSSESCGIDCSGFVSRCWKLPRPYSTREMPSICIPLKSWAHLKPGDILLNHQHVVLFAGWQDKGKSILGYEAGPIPVWRVNACGIPVAKLLREGYAPWRYAKIVD
jgi:hypothetical protein